MHASKKKKKSPSNGLMCLVKAKALFFKSITAHYYFLVL